MDKQLKHLCEIEEEEAERLAETLKNTHPIAMKGIDHLAASKLSQIKAENEELGKEIGETSKPMFPEKSTNELLEEDLQSLKDVLDTMTDREGNLTEKIAFLNDAIREEQNIDASDFKEEEEDSDEDDSNAQEKLIKLKSINTIRKDQLQSLLEKFHTPQQEDFNTNDLPEENEILSLKRVFELLINAKRRDSKNPWIEVTRGIHPSFVNMLLQCRIISRNKESFNLIGLQDDMEEDDLSD